MSRSKTVVKSTKSVGSKLEELINVKPINVATKKDVAGVNYLVRKNLMTTDEVVKEAIATNNPTIMWMVGKFVNGITKDHEVILNLAIQNSSEKPMYRESERKVVNCSPSLPLRELKLLEKREKIAGVVQKYAQKSIEELIQFSPVTMYASKRNVRAINYLIHKGLKTVDEVVDEAIKSKNPLVMYYVALFVNDITDYHLGMIISGMNKCTESLDIRVDIVMQNLANKRPDKSASLVKGVVRTGCVSGMVSFANNVENAPIVYLAKNILEKAINQDDATYIYYFVRDNLADLTEDYIKKAANKIMELKNSSVICSFAKFGGATILEYAKALIEAIDKKQDNAVYLYLFALENESAQEFPEFIIDELISTNNYSIIYRAARDLKHEISVEKLVKKLGENAMAGNIKCRDYLASLALSEDLAAPYAVDEIINLEDPILITYVLQNCKNVELSNKLQDCLNSLPCLEGESLNDNGVMEMPLIRKKDEDGRNTIVVES